MNKEIASNITTALSKPLEKERVVYVMIEVRRLIEKSEKELLRWGILKFWCDWVVHTKMDRKFSKDVLIKMEEYLQKPGEKFHWSDFNSRFISIENLRWELREFLKSKKISTSVTDIPPWNTFCKYLVEHLRDCPLSKDDGLIREFRFIKKPHIKEAEKYSIDFKVSFDGSRNDFDGSVLRFDRENRK